MSDSMCILCNPLTSINEKKQIIHKLTLFNIILLELVDIKSDLIQVNDIFKIVQDTSTDYSINIAEYLEKTKLRKKIDVKIDTIQLIESLFRLAIQNKDIQAKELEKRLVQIIHICNDNILIGRKTPHLTCLIQPDISIYDEYIFVFFIVLHDCMMYCRETYDSEIRITISLFKNILETKIVLKDAFKDPNVDSYLAMLIGGDLNTHSKGEEQEPTHQEINQTIYDGTREIPFAFKFSLQTCKILNLNDFNINSENKDVIIKLNYTITA